MVSRLLTFDEAAAALNVPVGSLRSAADEHGLTIRMGRAVRLDPNSLEELIDLCRVEPKARPSTGETVKMARPSGKHETPRSHQSRPAQIAAQKLKDISRKS